MNKDTLIRKKRHAVYLAQHIEKRKMTMTMPTTKPVSRSVLIKTLEKLINLPLILDEREGYRPQSQHDRVHKLVAEASAMIRAEKGEES